MKNLIRISVVILIIFVIQSCKKDKPPELITTDVTGISYTTATSGGDVTNEGGASIITRGICWNTSADPTISNSKTTESGGLGAFTSNITNLTPNTLYYVRAYATNSAGTGYGNQVTFTTTQLAVPALTTTAISTITQSSAASGGNITADNGGTITARGVCWGTATNPTTANSKTTDGTGTGSFTSTLTGLTGNTLYYVRAYATNSVGTSYGNELTFTTSALTPTLTTTAIGSITSATATSGGNISSDGGATITARGVCWNILANPTIANNKTSDGPGTGIFVSTIAGLNPGTTYYVKAYATNSAGTTYGNELSFTTLASVPTLTTTATSLIAQTTATSGGNISSDGGATITARGVCWSTSSNPVVTGSHTTDASGTGSFVSNLTGLTANTTYYVRAYATNSAGTAYGNQVSFTTTQIIAAATVSTTTVTTFTFNTATVGGDVSSDGNSTVTERGIYYGTSSSPETTGTKLQIGSGTGSFSSILLDLIPNTTYYVKAYAINSVSTSYGNDLTFILWINQPGPQVNDIDGNTYNSVKIGNQIWMRENLKTIKYNDGTSIPLVTNATTWSNQSASAYCWYNNDETANKATYGAMYNWYAVNTGKLCPTGWHAFSDPEWNSLMAYLGSDAGGKLKETGTTHWQSPNNGATNVSGFTALPGGYRDPGGTFFDIGYDSNWWSSTEYSTTYAYRWIIMYSGSSIPQAGSLKQGGYSVRCIKDN
jgi:uncharacterized protein (TIGR02145 family)